MKESVPVTMERHVPLPPYDPEGVCPKCGYATVGTQWYAGRSHDGCPFYGQNAIIADNISSVLFDGIWKPGERRANKAYDEWMESYRDRTRAVEHYDRLCTRCHYGWIEQRLGGFGAGSE